MAGFTPVQTVDGKLSQEALLEQWALISASYGGRIEDLQKLLDTAGGGTVELWSHRPGELPPAWSLSRQGDHYYLAIAGTTEAKQWLKHVEGAVASESDFEGARSNRFWQQMWGTMKVSVQAKLPPPGAKFKLTITGHSMGGAVAQVAAYELAKIYGAENIELVTMSAPKAFTEGYTGPQPSVYFRASREGDPVTYMPANTLTQIAAQAVPVLGHLIGNRTNWKHYGTGVMVADDGSLGEDPGEYLGGWVDLWRIDKMSFDAHRTGPISDVLTRGVDKASGVSPRARVIAGQVRDLEKLPKDPALDINVKPSSYIPLDEANRLYFGSVVGPLRPADLDSPQLLAVQVTGNAVVLSGNIRRSIGADMAYGPLWKFTAHIKAGDRGKSTSIIHRGGTLIQSEFPNAFAWAQNLCKTLGNEGINNVPETGATAGSPKIVFIRVTDALNPRFGQLLKTKSSNLQGDAATGGSGRPADFVSTALSINLIAQSSDTSKKLTRSNHGFVGVPDATVINGDQIDLSEFRGPRTFRDYVSTYLEYITNPNNNLGCLTVRDAEDKKAASNATRVGAVWNVTVPAHGYNSGDKVRLTGANAPFFNGTYSITVVDPNTIGILNSAPQGAAPFTLAKVQRVAIINQPKPMVFAQFLPPAGGFVADMGLSVSKRNPAKPFVPVSFNKKKKRPH
jgi:hypothetical protein